MASTTAARKGILKSSSSSRAPPKSKDEQNREKALFHARLIQQQKDIELEILGSLETLLDFPSSAQADPVHPSDPDAAAFKAHLRYFRASDFDDLIEERNISGMCGYALCPRHCPEEDGAGKFKINRGKFGPDVVESKKVQRFCGVPCKRYAMYVKVQLSHEPAWLRPPNTVWDLELLNEGEAKATSSPLALEALERRMGILKLEQQNAKQIPHGPDNLALERGDNSNDTQGRVGVTITENDIRDARIQAPELQTGQDDTIEGYIPKGLQNLSLDDNDDKDMDGYFPRGLEDLNLSDEDDDILATI